MKKRRLYAIYAISFVIVFLIGFLPVLAERRSLVGHDDAFNEYYCAFVYIGRWIRSAISGNFHLYDTSIAMGESVIGVLNYYGFGDILLIPFTLFPEEYIHYGYTLSIVGRLFLAGIAFLFYWDRKGQRNIWCILAALFYVFSPYTMTEGLLFHCYVTVLVWLPLIMTGVEEVFKSHESNDSKWYFSRILIFSVFFLSLTGFYFLYMVIIYVAVWMLVDIVLQRDKRKIRFALTVVAEFALGMGLAGFMLMPAVKYFLQSPRSGKASFLSAFLELPTKDTIIGAINNLITPPRNIYDYLAFTLPIIIVLCMITLIAHKNIEKRSKLIIGTVLCLYGYFFPAVGTMMNGFERHYDRWIFLAEFFFACLFIYVAPELVRAVPLPEKIVFVVLFISWLGFKLYFNEISTNDYPLLIFYVMLWVILLIALCLSRSHKIAGNIFCILCMINICANVFFMNASESLGGSATKEFFRSNVRGTYTETPIYWNSQLSSDRVFERYDIINGNMRDLPLICGLNTTYGSYSIDNGRIWDLKGRLNMQYPLHGLDSRQVLESLMCVTNYSTEGWSSWETENNDYYLPLGIVFDRYTTRDVFGGLSPLEKQNALFDAVVLESDGSDYQGTEITPDTGEITEIPSELKFIDCEVNSDNKLVTKSGSRIEVHFEPDAEVDGKTTELYLAWDNAYSPTKVGIDIESTYINMNTDNQYLVCVDYVRNKGVVNITINSAAEITLGDIKLYKSKIGDFVQKYNYYSEHCLKDAKWEGDSYSGITRENKDGYLFIALPYIDGWKCSVDNVKTDILRADYNFMAIFVPAGEHYVKITYSTPWLAEGIIISIGCAIILLTIVVFLRKKRCELPACVASTQCNDK